MWYTPMFVVDWSLLFLNVFVLDSVVSAFWDVSCPIVS